MVSAAHQVGSDEVRVEYREQNVHLPLAAGQTVTDFLERATRAGIVFPEDPLITIDGHGVSESEMEATVEGGTTITVFDPPRDIDDAASRPRQ